MPSSIDATQVRTEVCAKIRPALTPTRVPRPITHILSSSPFCVGRSSHDYSRSPKCPAELDGWLIACWRCVRPTQEGLQVRFADRMTRESAIALVTPGLVFEYASVVA